MKNIKKISSLAVSIFMVATNISSEVNAGRPESKFEIKKKNDQAEKDPIEVTIDRLVKNGDYRAIERYLSENDKWKDYALFSPAKCNATEVARFLIEKGANVNARDNFGFSPLHYAAKYNTTEVAEFLIARGADVNARDNVGWRPLHVAAQFNSREVAELLIAKGANVNARNNWGISPSHVAAKSGAKEVIDLLKKNGARL